jgi:hypothetical protein
MEDLKYYIFKIVLYFYSWLKMSYSYWFSTTTQTINVYVWDNRHQTMRRYKEQQQQQDEYLLYYVLCDGSILVFQDAQRMREVVDILRQEEAVLQRRSFRYFMEAEIGTEKTLEEDVLPLLTSYDDGHGTFFQDLTHYALTPADLYNFNSGRHVIYDDTEEFLRVTPMATLEPRTIAARQKIAATQAS